MLKNIIELADNKLFILYIIKKLKHPCSNMYITDIVLNNNFLNYFLLQQYLSELVENNYLMIVKVKDEEMYKIAPRGKKVLEMFQNRISQFKIDCFNNYMDMLEKKSKIISSDITNKDGQLEISFKRDDSKLLNLTIHSLSEEDIKTITKNCTDNAEHIYNLLISSIKKAKNDT